MSVRLSHHEAAALDEIRGGLSRANYLRSLIPGAARVRLPAVPTITDHAYPGEPPMVDQEFVTPAESPLTEQMPEETETVSTNDAEEVAVKKHFHKRGAVITSRYDKGIQITTYACAQDGCPHTMKG